MFNQVWRSLGHLLSHLRSRSQIEPHDLVPLQKLVFDAFVEYRVSTFQRITAVKNRAFCFLQQN